MFYKFLFPFLKLQKSPPQPNNVNKGTKITLHTVQSPTLVANCLNKYSNTSKTNSPDLEANSSIANSCASSITPNNYNGSSGNNKTENNDVADTTDEFKPNSSFSDNHALIDPKTDINSKVMNEEVKDSSNIEMREHNYAFQDDYDVSRESTSSVPDEYDDVGIPYDDGDDNYGGGIRERSLLCPILEEDGESTASTSSLTASSLTAASSRVGY